MVHCVPVVCRWMESRWYDPAVAAEVVRDFADGPGALLARHVRWLPPRPMAGPLALPPTPDVVEGRRLVWRDTSLALIVMALVGALLLAGTGGSVLARSDAVPVQAAAAAVDVRFAGPVQVSPWTSPEALP
jgi:hypothetical protein